VEEAADAVVPVEPVGLALESAASMLEGPMAGLILRVVDDLERLLEQIRSEAFEQQARLAAPPSPEEQ
jgi:hypothetical protein